VDRPLPLGGTRPRAVLAALLRRAGLLGRNTVVPVERLVSAIWEENPPGTPPE
jgi:DNA-binding SARP family transcriptional activator